VVVLPLRRERRRKRRKRRGIEGSADACRYNDEDSGS
jgi:hypothetical protein